jgi:hypothetical protein
MRKPLWSECVQARVEERVVQIVWARAINARNSVLRDGKCMFALRTWVILGMLLFLTSLPLMAVPGMGAGEVNQLQASSALAESEAAVVSAYQVVANASAAGANVSGLLVRLNEAGDLLTRAHVAYGLGDFDSALELADLCQERLTGFVSEADALADVAFRDHYLDFMLGVVGSLLGSLWVVSVGFVAWVYLNRRYGRNGSQAQ